MTTLEALIALVDAVERYESAGGFEVNLDDVLEAARDAIKNAEGEAE